MANFDRRYTLRCGKRGGSGFLLGGQGADPLHISFSVEKSDSETLNTAKVHIWNLGDANLRILEEPDLTVELSAGYGNQLPVILVGNVTFAATETDRADRVTVLEVSDGRVALRDAYLTLSLNEIVDSKAVYEAIAAQMGLSLIFADDLSFVTFPTGYCFVGKAKDALHRVCAANGHTWTIQNGILQITLPGRPLHSKGYLLSGRSGLIGTPKRIIISRSGEDTAPLTGWEITYLLNGAIGVNDVVQIESSSANGYYRVHKVTMDGDNLEGDWICTAQVLEIQSLPRN